MKLENAQHFAGPSLYLQKPCVLAQLAEVPSAQAATLVVELAIELQKRAGYEVALGRATPLEDPACFRIAVEAEWGRATVAALRCAVALATHRLGKKAATAGAREEELLRRYFVRLGRRGLSVSHRYLLHEARRAGIAARALDDQTLLFGLGCRARKMQRMMTDATSYTAVMLSTDKTATLAALSVAGVPVPNHILVSDEAGAIAAAERIGWPVVVKPTHTDHGTGVSTGLASRQEVVRAYRRARQFDAAVAVESFIPGETFRLLVIGGRFVAASRTAPAAVTGDGVQTVRALVAAANRDPRRGPDHTQSLSWIEPDEESDRLLAAAGLAWDAVPAAGREVRLQSASNLSRGGMSVDVTDRIHPAYRALAERAARTIGLDLAGIDLRARAIETAPEAGTGAIIEVNPTPGLRLHYAPAIGRGVNVARHVLEFLYPPGSTHRIPVAAITGTNGKTTTSRLLAHILAGAGYRVGRATTGEFAIGDTVIRAGDCAGAAYARRVLESREVEAAVLETARGGIIKWGLGFESCDAAAVLNVADDHIGLDGITDLEQMAAVKRLVADTATGTLVLNAEDARCLAMAQGRRASRVILFSLDASHPSVAAHARDGGTAYVIAGEGPAAEIVRLADARREALCTAGQVPVAFEGAARFNLANAAAALALAEGLGVPQSTALQGLRTFQTDFAGNPGRLNLCRDLPFEVMLDYAHNAHGLARVLPLIARIPARGRRICCFGVNGRSHDNERAMRHAALLAPHFDLFVPYTWDHPKKRRDDLPGALRQGLLNAGIAAEAVRPYGGEGVAIEAALDWARAGDLLTVFWGTDERRAWQRIIARRTGGII